ncbi:hypothetical protein [Metaclostridioides mangenotii]|uniref:Uncharacterized protein n=1 Tax=Metaclostridioides mangenotii TaxID=1540 RepID=A0ABS4EAW3_9FIRM|nr:hypothetical protein [Clostridioides mangenotii]MBP1855086.1 hypothetical protein [Clostridioides mangenotii]
MKKILITIFVILIMILGVTGYYFKQNKLINGKNENSIKKYLYNTLIPKTEDINIIDTVEIEDSKIVGFLNNKGLGVVAFDKDKKGNYTTGRDGIFETIDKKHVKVSAFSVRYGDSSKSSYVIISDGKDVGRVELVVNEKKSYSKKVKLSEPSMVIFTDNELSKLSTSRDIKFKFFNSDGTLIEDYTLNYCNHSTGVIQISMGDR